MKNYTPLNIKKVGKKPRSGKANTVLIIIAILTACVLAFILLLLIKDKMSTQPEKVEQTQEVVPPPPIEDLDEEATPSPELGQDQMTGTPAGSMEATQESSIIPQ